MNGAAHWRPPALLFGLPIDDLTMAETLDVAGELIASGRRQHRTHQIATVNLDFVVNALDDPENRRLLQRADVCLADGMPVVWGARTLGMRVTERVAGADLVPALAERAAAAGWRIHLFGSADGIAERAAGLLRERHNGLAITAASGPMITDMATVPSDVLDEITDLDPDILCVAMGNPKQERFIDAFRGRLKTPLMLGIGGSLDMLVGDKRRAPHWIQRAGFEWLFRTAQEPARLGKRYARDGAVFFPRLVSAHQDHRHQFGSGQIVTESRSNDDRAAVVVRGWSTGAVRAMSWSDAVHALANGAPLHLDLGTSEALSVESLSHVIGLIRAAHRGHAPIVRKYIADPIMRQVETLGLVDFVDDPDVTA